jgi:preprotein translocase subunit SecA
LVKIRPARTAQDGADAPPDQAAVLRFCRQAVAEAGALEAAARSCTDDDLRRRTQEYRERLTAGAGARDLLPEAFATVREAARRAIGQRHHDVQVMGGAALHLGGIVEMRTGEGKTLTATLPAYLAALSGEPVHVMTANDYLASRDRAWMAPVYEFLGLTTGLLEPARTPDRAVRRAEYAADVTYGPWAEFCYDFLRDNGAWEPGEVSQRGLGLVIVDEADLVLIDEMRALSSLSSPAGTQEDRKKAEALTKVVARVVGALRPDADFATDPHTKTASLTESGQAAIEDALGIDDLYEAASGRLAGLVESAVRARAYQRDRDYLVSDGQVMLIDQRSGRPLQSRVGDGVHEALEAREGLPVQPREQTRAAIALREYVRQYRHLTGMTGTAASDAPVYRELYGLDVTVIPTNRPVIRTDLPDLLYRTRQAKLAALAGDASRRAAAGQPVLIGAMSDGDAEAVAALLAEAGTGCEVLAARNFEREARVLADAGRPGAVTIVVKMAGRGVDIVLGGSAAGHDAVAEMGGLCVLGTERTGDRRTELHLRGRAGRQGDPGESVFYLSSEDGCVASMVRLPRSLQLPDGTPFRMLSQALDKAQFNQAAAHARWYQAEAEFDDVLGAQLQAFYAERRSILAEPDMRSRMTAIVEEVITAKVAGALQAGSGPDILVRELNELCRIGSARAAIVSAMQGRPRDREAATVAAALRAARQAYADREAQVGERMHDLERRLLLAVADRAWPAHLAAMADLRTELMIRDTQGPRALAEYQRRARAQYTEMTARIKLDAVGYLFNIEIEAQTSG